MILLACVSWLFWVLGELWNYRYTMIYYMNSLSIYKQILKSILKLSLVFIFQSLKVIMINNRQLVTMEHNVPFESLILDDSEVISIIYLVVLISLGFDI